MMSFHQETAISSPQWLKNELYSFIPTVSSPGSMEHETDQLQGMFLGALSGTTTRPAVCCITRVSGHRLHIKFLSYNMTTCCTNTLPEASKALQAPSGLSIPSFRNCTEVVGFSKMLTPPTKAALHCP